MRTTTLTTIPATRRRTIVLVVAAAILAGVLPAAAGPGIGGLTNGDPEPFPRVAFVARNDVPFDSLSLGPVAGALGGIVVITSTDSLSADAEQGLTEFDPDVVYIAGGPAAVSQTTADQIAAAGDWDVVRVGGANRDETARMLGEVLATLGVGRPLLSSPVGRAVSGDAAFDGTITAGALELADGPRTWAREPVDGAHVTPAPVPIPVTSVSVEPPGAGLIVLSGSVRVTNTGPWPAYRLIVPATGGPVTYDAVIPNGESHLFSFTAAVAVDGDETGFPVLVMPLSATQAQPASFSWQDATVVATYTPESAAELQPAA